MTPQALLAQPALPPLGGGLHVVPQVPQLPVSVVSSTQALPQSVRPVPVPQPIRQAPAAQETSPPVGAAHELLQPPQLAASVCVLTQPPLQTLRLAVHWMPQTPAAHVAVPFVGGPWHAVPHAPQWAMSVCVSTQLLPHAMNCGASQVTPHVPAMHVAAPFAGFGQTFPQAPQLATSPLSSTHAPRHVEKVGSHWIPHTPDVQVPCPFSGSAQAFPQAPQFFVSVCSARQAPLQTL